jgi:uncharacterized protein YprB with RNaseH-like and TPR domain
MGSIKRLDLYRRGRGVQREKAYTGERSVERLSLLERLKEETGGQIVTREGKLYLHIEELIPQNYIHGSVSLKRSYENHEGYLDTLFPSLTHLGEQRNALRDMLFFDIETTGLSGGAGTHLFLMGMLRVTEGGILFTQFFLHSLSSERFFLNAIAEGFTDSKILVSYNGKSYDYNILKNRYIMTGLPFFSADPLHLDLLYTSRRIWRGLFPDYTLSTVENRTLQVKRREDIPGWQIPEVYADYLRGRNVGVDMLRIIQHNREDVLSLLALLIRQIDLLRDVVKGRYRNGKQFNPIAISDMLVSSERREDAVSLLTEHEHSTEALKRLALLCKREGHFEKALKHFEDLRLRKVGLGDYIFSCTEAAKIYEHQLRDFHSAIRCTERMLRRVERASHLRGQVGVGLRDERYAIVHRLNRLKRKLDKDKMEKGGLH